MKSLITALVLACSLGACSGSDGPVAPITPPAAAPQITTQPQDVAAATGAAAVFSVSATSASTLSYQWRRDGTALAGETGSGYSMNPTAPDNGARFSVAVTNSAGTTVSRGALLTVRSAPSIIVQPLARATLSGVPAVLTVAATGSSLSYQWRRNGVAISGATGGSHAIGVPLAGDDGASYSVVVSNDLGSVTSIAASLSVSTGPGLRPTSYAFAKGSNNGAVSLPTYTFTTRAFGDFLGNDERDFFVATLEYDAQRPQSEARRGEFRFYRLVNGSYLQQAGRIDDPTGCIHPRKAVVADFNRDQKPDIFVACHGYDAAPFPGESNYVLLSQPNGVYISRPVGVPGFYHSATAADINNDGFVDVVVTDSHASRALLVFANDGQGNFTLRSDLFSIPRANYFTVEAADVDNDGRTDIIAGGHDWENAPATVLLNNGSGTFASAQTRILPAVPNEGVVLDFVVVDADRDGNNEVYVLRTSGGDGTFYQSVTVQKVTWPSLSSSVLMSQRGRQWVDYVFPVFSGGRYTLVSDNTLIPLLLPL
jgi:hypothetical protein